ncbi:MAG: hypothetical protein GX826_05380 [Gammaproteobacteria bacterium]|nr:hypothetical protein [Gammaproteobacteria bacterium]
MDNVIQFKRPAPKPRAPVRTEELCIYLDVVMHMRNYLICTGNLALAERLVPYVRQALDEGWVYADFDPDEELKAEVRALLDNCGKNDLFMWKGLYEKSIEADDE